MGKPSVPTNQTTTNRSETVLDPAIRNALMQNVDLSKLLTSGMLPRQAGGAGAAPGAVGGAYGGSYSPSMSTGGMSMQFDENGNPVTTPFDPGSDPGNYINPDGTPYVPPTSFTAGFDPTQVTAQDRYLGEANRIWSPEYLGGDVYKRLENFVTPEMRAASVSPVAGYAAPQMTAAGGATARNFTDLDFSKYAAPFADQVINPLSAYIGEMGDRAVASTAATGRVGSAVRGSNDMLRESLIRGENTLQGSQAISGALQNMFGTSAALATGDLNREADTSRFNVGQTNQMAMAQGNLDADAARTDYMGRLQSAITNAGFDQQARSTNVDSAFRSPLLQAQGAQMGANATMTARDLNIDNANVMDAVGGARQGMTQARMDDPWRALQMRISALSGAIPATSGSSSTTVAPGQYRSSGGAAGAMGGALGAAGIANLTGMMGTAGGAGVAAAAASPWLWPLIIGGGLVGAM